MFEPLLGQDFIHLNGDTVLNESTGAAHDVVMLELYGEGGCCLTWANRHIFQPRTLSYTVTLTTKHARQEAREEAAAEQRAERERREESMRKLNEYIGAMDTTHTQLLLQRRIRAGSARVGAGSSLCSVSPHTRHPGGATESSTQRSVPRSRSVYNAIGLPSVFNTHYFLLFLLLPEACTGFEFPGFRKVVWGHRTLSLFFILVL